jgi:lipoprotein-anchoring transpeptidase ErfK/SrfK
VKRSNRFGTLMDLFRAAFLAMAACVTLNAGAAKAQFSDFVAEHDAQIMEAERAEREARRAASAPVVYPKHMDGGERPDIAPAKPPVVYFDRSEQVGSIIIDTQSRKLYFVLPDKQAYEYPISVGREGFTWTGTERISRIASWPSWTPPPEMHERVPGLPLTVSGGLKNPQGARALYLGNTVYRIHGTNNDRTVGRANSSGCFRLTNEHVVHLASIAKVGTKVSVLQAYSGGVSETVPLSSLFEDFFGSEPPPAKPKAKKPAAAKKKPAATATTSTTAPGASAAAAAAPNKVAAE